MKRRLTETDMRNMFLSVSRNQSIGDVGLKKLAAALAGYPKKPQGIKVLLEVLSQDSFAAGITLTAKRNFLNTKLSYKKKGEKTLFGHLIDLLVTKPPKKEELKKPFKAFLTTYCGEIENCKKPDDLYYPIFKLAIEYKCYGAAAMILQLFSISQNTLAIGLDVKRRDSGVRVSYQLVFMGRNSKKMSWKGKSRGIGNVSRIDFVAIEYDFPPEIDHIIQANSEDSVNLLQGILKLATDASGKFAEDLAKHCVLSNKWTAFKAFQLEIRAKVIQEALGLESPHDDEEKNYKYILLQQFLQPILEQLGKYISQGISNEGYAKYNAMLEDLSGYKFSRVQEKCKGLNKGNKYNPKANIILGAISEVMRVAVDCSLSSTRIRPLRTTQLSSLLELKLQPKDFAPKLGAVSLSSEEEEEGEGEEEEKIDEKAELLAQLKLEKKAEARAKVIVRKTRRRVEGIEQALFNRYGVKTAGVTGSKDVGVQVGASFFGSGQGDSGKRSKPSGQPPISELKSI